MVVITNIPNYKVFHFTTGGAAMVVIVWWLDLQLPM